MGVNESPEMNKPSDGNNPVGTQNAGNARVPEEQTDSILDEQVATMTDTIMAAGTAGQFSRALDTDDELRALEGVIVGLAGMLNQPPPAALAERLNARLDEEWARRFGAQAGTSATAERTAQPASPLLPRALPMSSSTDTRPALVPLERKRPQPAPRSAKPRQNWTVMALAAAVLALVAASVLLVPREESVTGTLSGTALGNVPAEAVIVLAAVVGVGILVLAVRRRR